MFPVREQLLLAGRTRGRPPRRDRAAGGISAAPQAALVGVQYVNTSGRRGAHGWYGGHLRARGCSRERISTWDPGSLGAVSRSTRSRVRRRPASSRGRDPTPLRPRHESPDDVRTRDGTPGRGCSPLERSFTQAVTSDPVVDRVLGDLWARLVRVSARLAVASALRVSPCWRSPVQHTVRCLTALVCKLPRDSTRTAPASRSAWPHQSSAPRYPLVALATPRRRRRPLASSTDWSQPLSVGVGETYVRQPGSCDTRLQTSQARGPSVFFFHAERREEPRGKSIFDFTRPRR